MKLLLPILLLLFPLVSAAAAYQWVDENDNVRFGSKPKAEKSEPAAKAEPKTPAKKPDKPSKVKTLPDRAQPAATAPKIRRGKSLPLSDPARVKPATRTMPVERKKKPKPGPAKPVLRAIPTPKPAPVPKAKTPPIPVQRAGKPPEPQPAGSIHKPARKKPATEKAIAKKTPAPKPAAAETETGADKDKDEELCGMFTNFASNYQNKLIDCQGASCTIYEKSLIKYQKKQQAYCR